MKNKNSAAILAFFLGGVGVHKFYLGQTGWGIVYALFFWTHIPTLAGWIEGLILLTMPQATFDQKYNNLALMGYASRQLTNQGEVTQVVVNINGEQFSTSTHGDRPLDQIPIPVPPTKDISPEMATEQLDRRILQLCQTKGEMTFLDCFMAIDDVPRSTLESRLESLVSLEFLQIGNRYGDGKVVYRLDN